MADNIIVIRDPQTTIVVDAPSSSGVAVVPGSTVVVDDNGLEVVISNTGLQGPPGPAGAPGGARFEQSFTTTSVVVVNHMLGYEPHVSVIVGGESVDTDIVYSTLNQVTVTFAAPKSGKVVCS